MNTQPSRQIHSSRHARFQRRFMSSVCAASLMLQQACYNAIPVAGVSTVPQGPVIITINDRGRLLVGTKLGTLLDRVEGRIIRADSLQVEIAVATAEDARGDLARWGGERFIIPREGIASIVEKKISRRRSALVIGGIAAGILAFGVLLKTAFTPSSGGGPGPDPI